MLMTNSNVASQSISMIVKRYRGEKSLRGFASDLSSRMDKPITYQTIKNWENGNRIPDYYFILAIALQNDDWRRQFALEILAILKQELYKPDQPRFDPLKGIS